MATRHSSAASAASVRRRTHATYIICALIFAAWSPAETTQDIRPPLTKQIRHLSQTADLAGPRKVRQFPWRPLASVFNGRGK